MEGGAEPRPERGGGAEPTASRGRGGEAEEAEKTMKRTTGGDEGSEGG